LRIRWPNLTLLLLICALVSVLAFERLVVDAELDHDNRRISGKLSTTLDHNPQWGDLHLRLYPNQLSSDSADGITIDSIFVDGEDLTHGMVTRITDMSVNLDRSKFGSDSITLVCYFTTTVMTGGDRFTYDHGQYMLENWFPLPAPRREGQWLLIDYCKKAEPVADFFDFDVTISYPDSLQLLAPGLASVDTVGNLLRARVNLPEAHECPILLNTDMLHDQSLVENVSIDIYYRPDFRWAIDSLRFVARRSFEIMIDEVGEYPYDELIIVVGAMPAGGLELPRMITMQEPPNVWLTRWTQATVAHEVVHQWFYGIVNSDQANHPWLDESTTEYFTDKVMRRMYGDRVNFLSNWGWTTSFQAMHRFMSRNTMGLLPITRPACDFEQLTYFRTVYAKGSLIMQTLTGLMGEDREREFWHAYVGKYRLAAPNPDDFFALANEYLPYYYGNLAQAVINYTNRMDLSIVDVREVSQQVLDSLVTDNSEGELYSTEIVYELIQPLNAPIWIRVDLADGRSEFRQIEPVSGQHTLTELSTQPVVGAVIDPDRVYAIDVNLLNNSLSRQQSNSVGLRMFSGLTFITEVLFDLAWGW